MRRSEDDMSFLVMGCGSIGERHIANLKALLPQARIDVFDPEPARLNLVKSKHNIRPVMSDAILSTPYDCVLICTPPISHMKLAIHAVAAGSNVFVEKPLSTTLANIDTLKDLLNSKSLHAYVGYNLRFNKGINTVKKMVEEKAFGRTAHASAYFGQYLPDWRPSQDYRNSYTANRELGGGIVFDASHEIDYLIWILGKPEAIQSDYATTDIIKVNTEAIADVIVKFPKNIQGHIHMDFIRREYKRALELLCENGIIEWLMSDQTVHTFDSESKSWSAIKVDQPINNMYIDEMHHVVSMIKTKSKSPVIDLEDGLSTLKASLAIHQSSKLGKKILL